MKKAFVLLLIVLSLLLGACATDASVASRNISAAADQFEVVRRVVFYNGVTDTYMLEVTGLCSIQPDVAQNQLEVTCKVGEGQYVKHFFGLSDNSLYFAEQLVDVEVSPSQYRVIFKPASIVPDIDLVP